jgi:hypothetical protein
LIVAVIELGKKKRRPTTPLERALVESTLELPLNQNPSDGNQFAKIHHLRQTIGTTHEFRRFKSRLRPLLQAT